MTAKLMSADAIKMSESRPRTRREIVRARESLSTTSTNPLAGPSEHSSRTTTDTDHAAMPMSDPPPAASEHGSHHHHMTPAMLLVEREHFWFMIVGLAIALFKFVSDADLFRRRFVPYLWPSTMILLGILLTLYHE